METKHEKYCEITLDILHSWNSFINEMFNWGFSIYQEQTGTAEKKNDMRTVLFVHKCHKNCCKHSMKQDFDIRKWSEWNIKPTRASKSLLWL